MFLRARRASTDPQVRSLLQKAVRRGYSQIVKLASTRLDANGDRTWLRSRTIVITFEECWPLAAPLSVDRDLTSKQNALLKVTNSAKQKDAASLGALAYAYHEGDHSMLGCVPEPHDIRIISEALNRPAAFFVWVFGESNSQWTRQVIRSAERYLAAATWQWDKACILAGAFLATKDSVSTFETSGVQTKEFPYWVALDKHTPVGKVALREVSEELNSSYRKLIWASFYFESALVNQLLPSPWWEAEKTWRLRRAGLSVEAAEELWSSARPLVRRRLEAEAMRLKHLVEAGSSREIFPVQTSLV